MLRPQTVCGMYSAIPHDELLDVLRNRAKFGDRYSAAALQTIEGEPYTPVYRVPACVRYAVRKYIINPFYRRWAKLGIK